MSPSGPPPAALLKAALNGYRASHAVSPSNRVDFPRHRRSLTLENDEWLVGPSQQPIAEATCIAERLHEVIPHASRSARHARFSQCRDLRRSHSLPNMGPATDPIRMLLQR
jgi:hypothetical protein